MTGTGPVGAAIGLVLSGALFVLLDRTRSSEPALWWFLALIVLYPVGAVVGYDLARRGGPLAGDGPLARVGGYAGALAGAHVFIAASFVLGVGLGLPGRSPYWAMAYAACVVGAAGGWQAAALAGGRYFVPPGALIGGSVVVLVMAWIAYFIAAGALLSRIDS